MSPFITAIFFCLIALIVLVTLIDFIFTRKIKNVLIKLSILIIIIFTLVLTTGFPKTRTTFGGTSSEFALIIICLSTVLGMVSDYFFYRKGKFSWRSFLKPLALGLTSILIPLVGLIQGISSFTFFQLIGLSLLAYQNGLYWKSFHEHTKSQYSRKIQQK